MYEVKKNFADLEESPDKNSISTAVVFEPTYDNQDGINTRTAGCGCGGCGGGLGDLSTAFSTGDWTQLFVDPNTGGFSWTTAAILGGGAIALWLLLRKRRGRGLGFGSLFGDDAKQRALASAKSAYEAERRQIQREYE